MASVKETMQPTLVGMLLMGVGNSWRRVRRRTLRLHLRVPPVAATATSIEGWWKLKLLVAATVSENKNFNHTSPYGYETHLLFILQCVCLCVRFLFVFLCVCLWFCLLAYVNESWVS